MDLTLKKQAYLYSTKQDWDQQQSSTSADTSLEENEGYSQKSANSIASSTLQYVIDSLFHNKTSEREDGNSRKHETVIERPESGNTRFMDDRLWTMSNRLKEMRSRQHDMLRQERRLSIQNKDIDAHEPIEFMGQSNGFTEDEMDEIFRRRNREDGDFDGSDTEEMKETDNRVYIRMKRKSQLPQHMIRKQLFNVNNEVEYDEVDIDNVHNIHRGDWERREVLSRKKHSRMNDVAQKEKAHNAQNNGKMEQMYHELDKTRNEIEWLKERLSRADEERRSRSKKERKLRDIERQLRKLIDMRDEEIKHLKRKRSSRHNVDSADDCDGNNERRATSESSCIQVEKCSSCTSKGCNERRKSMCHTCRCSSQDTLAQSQILDSRQKNNNLEIALASRTAETLALVEERRVDRQRILDLEKELEKIRASNAQLVHELEQELEKTNSTHAQKIQSLEEQLQKEQNEHRLQKETSEHLLQEKDKTLSLLKKEFNEREEHVNQEIRRYQTKLQESRTNIMRLQKELEIQLSAAEQVFNSKVEEVLEREKQVKNSLREETRKVQDLETKLMEEKRSHKEELISLERRSEEQKERLRQYEDNLERAKAHIEKELRQRLKLIQVQKRLEQDRDHLQCTIRKYETEIEELSSQVGELESNIAVYKEMYDAVSKRDVESSQFSILLKNQAELDHRAEQLYTFMNDIFVKIQQSEFNAASIRQELVGVGQSQHEDSKSLRSREKSSDRKERSNTGLDISRGRGLQQEDELQKIEQLALMQRRYESDISDHRDKMITLMKDMNSYNSELDDIRQAFSTFKSKFLNTRQTSKSPTLGGELEDEAFLRERKSQSERKWSYSSEDNDDSDTKSNANNDHEYVQYAHERLHDGESESESIEEDDHDEDEEDMTSSEDEKKTERPQLKLQERLSQQRLPKSSSKRKKSKSSLSYPLTRNRKKLSISSNRMGSRALKGKTPILQSEPQRRSPSSSSVMHQGKLAEEMRRLQKQRDALLKRQRELYGRQ